MSWRIDVDADLCQGHGVCESEAPEVFEIGDDHRVRVLVDQPDADARPAVELAVRYCPTRALSIVDA
ncbi:MAG: ferredoxin [Actinomycetes bacterium]